MLEKFEGDEVEPEKFRDMFGPGQADRAVRNAIQMVWMTLPGERKTLDELEKEVRRLMDRALRDMHEDEKRQG